MIKFAVTHAVGNDEKVLKTFPYDEKERAIEYAERAAESVNSGVIACVSAQFDGDKIRWDSRKIYEVFETC